MRYYQAQNQPYVSSYVGNKYNPDLYLKAGAMLEDRLNQAEAANAKFQETGELTPGYFTEEEAKIFNQKTQQFKQQAEQAALAGKTAELRDAILKGQQHLNSGVANKIRQDYDYTQKYIVPERMKPGDVIFQGEGRDFSGLALIPEDAYKGNRNTFRTEAEKFAKTVVPDITSQWQESYTSMPDPVTGLLKDVRTGQQVSVEDAGREVFGRKFAPTVELMGSDLSNPEDFHGIPYENIKNLSGLSSEPGSANNPDYPNWSEKQQAVYERGLDYMKPAFHEVLKSKNTVSGLRADKQAQQAAQQFDSLFTGGTGSVPFEAPVEIKPGQDNIQTIKDFTAQANNTLITSEANGIKLNPQFIDSLEKTGKKDLILEQLASKDISQISEVDLSTLNTLIPGTQNLETKLETVKQIFNDYKEQKLDAEFYNTIVREGFEEAAKQGSDVIRGVDGEYKFNKQPSQEQIDYEYRQLLTEMLPNVDDPDSHIDRIPKMKQQMINDATENAYNKINESGYKTVNEYIDKKLGVITEDTKAFDLNLSTDAKTESPVVQGLYKQLAVPTPEIVKQYDIKAFKDEKLVDTEGLSDIKPLKVFYDGASGKLRFYGTAIKEEKPITITGDFTPAIEGNPDPSLQIQMKTADTYGKVFKKVATAKAGTDNIMIGSDFKINKVGDNAVRAWVKLPDGTWDPIVNNGNPIIKNLEAALGYSLSKFNAGASEEVAPAGKLIQVLREP